MNTLFSSVRELFAPSVTRAAPERLRMKRGEDVEILPELFLFFKIEFDGRVEAVFPFEKTLRRRGGCESRTAPTATCGLPPREARMRSTYETSLPT
jgi:hypothetical protein